MSETCRDIVTPEGIPLTLRVADAGDRAAAFALDTLIVTGVVLAFALLAGLAAGGDFETTWMGGFVLLVAFFLRNFYFAYFEVRWHGTTPGKRMIGLRVVDRRGGPLRTDAVIARNLVRDIEVYLPLQVIFAPHLFWPGAPGLVVLAASLWAFGLMLMPIFNRDRLRVGDLVAGTMVVRAPKAMLLPDLADAAPPAVTHALSAAQARTAYVFSAEQLAVYGIYELQVLEDVLRQDPTMLQHMQTLDAVCDRVKSKIRWDKDQWNVRPEQFLRDFYAALRARLEQDMLLGKRQEDKFSGK